LAKINSCIYNSNSKRYKEVKYHDKNNLVYIFLVNNRLGNKLAYSKILVLYISLCKKYFCQIISRVRLKLIIENKTGDIFLHSAT